MKLKKVFPIIAMLLVVLIMTWCKKDKFAEIVGVCPVVVSTNPTNGAKGVPLDQIITVTFNLKMNPVTINQASFIIQAATSVAENKSNPGTINLATLDLKETTPITGTVSSDGAIATFIPSSALLPNTTYTGRVTQSVKDLMGNALQTDYVWTFTTGISPRVTSTDPVNNATGVSLDKIVTATFSVPMDPLTLTAATFILKEGETKIAGTVTYSGSTASFKPSVPLTPHTVYTGTITTGAKNLQGIPLAIDYVWTFTAGESPTIIFTDPENNAAGVAVNKIITATFSVPMDPLTLTAATFTLAKGTTPVTGTVSYTGTTASFKPSGTLTPNTIYTATITTGAKNVLGTSLLDNYVWSFTTGGLPTVISTDPANEAIGVALDKIIIATFSVPMDPATITETSFTLQQGATPVQGIVSYTGTNASFAPFNALATNTVYTGTITTRARNVAGTAMANDYSWTFTTGALPTVISTDPANNATGVVLNKIIAATFSVPMDPLTLTATTFTIKQGATAVAGKVTYTGTIASFTPSNVLTPNTIYTGTITTGVKNVLGITMANDYVWTFTTEPPPTVISTDPANNATGGASNKIITATFSVPMDPLTLTASAFTIKQGATPIAGTVSHTGTTISFAPSSVLLPNTIYTGTITTGVKNVKGISMANDYVMTFTTGLSPAVVSTNPADNATGVIINKMITVNFSMPMDPETLDGTTFILKQGATPVAGKVTYTGTTASFALSGAFTPNTVYTGTITTGAKNDLGFPMVNDYVWTFTTLAPIAPTVISVDPLNEATDVILNKIIKATFSVPMDPTTLTISTFTVKQGVTPVAGAVSYIGTTASFVPLSPLVPNTIYTGTITTGAKNVPGTALVNNYVWTFTTVSTTAPTVISTDPANNATGVILNKIVEANFSVPMDPLTLTESTFTIKQGATPVEGSVSYSGTAATFTPSIAFAPNTLYTGTITTGAKNAQGTALTVNYVWTFTTIPQVTLSSSPSIGGTTTGQGLYNSDASVTVTATPNAGYIFTNWTVNGSIVSTSSSHQFIMAGNVALVANFIVIPPTQFAVSLSSNPPAGGKTTGQGLFNSGTSVSVTATPNAGYTFTNWTEGINIVSSSANYNFTLSGNTILVANFTPIPLPQFSVSLSGNPLAGGTTTGAGSFNSGASVTITAVPNAGYTFVNWTEGINVVSSSANYNFILNGNRTLVANFTIILPTQFSVSLSSNPPAGGTTTGGGAFNSGASVTVTATPNVGFTFTNWKEGLTIVSSNANYTFIANVNRTLVANFTAIASTFALNVTATNGTVVKNPNQVNYNSGTTVQLLATPNSGFSFTSWSGDATGSTNPLNVTMNANKNITANFTLIPITFTLNVTATNGTVVKNPNQATFDSGTTAQLTATPNAGFTFTSWSGDATGSTNPLTVTMNANKNITANFTAIAATFTLNVTATNGIVVKNPNQVNYNSGTGVQLTATPNAGFTFTSWSGDATGSTNPLTVIMNANKNITANFTLTPVTFTINVTATNGTIVKNPNQVNYNSGSTVQLTATPNSGFVFTSWSGDATGSLNPLTVNMNANKNITANFTAIPTVTSTDPANNATNVVLTKTITATFSVPMDQTTLTGSTFTVKLGAATVDGTISYAGSTVSFKPTGNLLSDNTYTATITTGAKNLAGVPLANNFVWNFSTVPHLGPLAADLKSVARFAIISGVGVSNNAGFSVINNLDIGISPGLRSSVTGFPPGNIVNGAIYAADDIAPPGTAAMLTQAKLDLTNAYLFAEGATAPAPATVAGDQGGKTLAPGIYKSTSTLLIQNGNLTLDAQGDANAVWIFQVASGFTTVGGAGGSIILTGGAQAKNIYWQVGSSAVIGDFTSFFGNVMALTSITMNSGAIATGRMLAINGSVVLTSTNIINKP